MMKDKETVNESVAMMVPASPELMMRQSSDVAGVCRSIVSETALAIRGRKFVKVEGWQSIATAHGCIAGAEEPHEVKGGVEARGYVRRLHDGQILSTGFGFVGEDEPTWFGGEDDKGKRHPKRPDFAIRAMAQTRAISRACRSAFAHVVVLMKAGLDTCPAEEVPAGGFPDAAPAKWAMPAPAKQAAAALAGQAAPATQAAPAANGEPDWRKVEVHFGKNKGTPLGALRPESLDWYRSKWEPRPNPNDGSMDPRDRVLRDALDLSMQENEQMAGMVGNLARELKDEGTDDILV